MGTISEKLTYLNGTKQKLKQAINNIGGEVTDETTFREYVNQLENAYDRLPKTEFEEGESVTLENTLKGKLDFDNGVVGFGQASQDSTQGYQLIDINSGEIVTVTFGVDRSINGNEITLNGSRNDGETSIGRIIIDNITEFNSLVSGRTYKLTLNDTSGTYTGKIGLAFLGGSPLHQLDFIETNSFSVTKTLNFSDEVTKIWLIFNGNFSATNFKFKLMLQEGSTAHEWEPYTNGASPNPSYPQEIKCVRGKNRFDKNSVTTGYYYNLNGALMTSGNWNVEQVEVQPNTKYYLSGNNYNNEIAGIVLLDKDKNFISLVSSYKNVHLITTTAITKYIGLSIANYSDNSDMDTLQLEEGSTSTPYLPYNTIEEVVSGKNLVPFPYSSQAGLIAGVNWSVNADGTINANGTSDNTSSIFYLTNGDSDIYLEAGTYKISTNKFTLANGFDIQVIKIVNGSYSTVYTGDMVLTEKTRLRVRVIARANAVVNQSNGYLMIERGNTATTYEPYITPTSYQLSLGEYEFNGIPNTDYRDELVYDVDEDKVYKNEVIKEITGTELMNISSFQNSSAYTDDTYLCCFNNAMQSTQYVNTKLYCNYFQGDYHYTIQKVANNLHMSASSLGICVLKSDFANVSALNDWWNNNGSKIKIYNVLRTPTKTEITDTTLINQVKALYNAHSLNGTTIITSNGNLPMIIKVRGLKGE